MSEIFEKLIYQPVRTARVGGAPSIDFAANKESIRSQSATADAMSRIASFAFESAKRSQQIAGAEAGVSNARGTLQALSGRDRASFSFEEQAAFEAASKTLSVELGIKAKQAMGEAVLKASNENYTPEELSQSLDAVIEGFAQSVDLLDPVSGQEFRLGLEDSRNAQYLNFSEKHLEKERQETRARTILNSDTFLQDIEFQAEQLTVNWDEKIDTAITQYMDYLSTGLLSPAEVAQKGLQAKKVANVARIKGEFGRLKTISDKKDYLDSLQNDIIRVSEKTDLTKPSDKGVTRGLFNSEAQAVLSSLAQEYNFELKVLSAKSDAVEINLKNSVTSIVNSGGVVSEDKITNIRNSIQELEEAGVDLEVVNKLKENLQSTEQNLDYIKGIKKFNLDELKEEVDQLDQQWQSNATPVIAFKLKQARAEFETKRQELIAQQAEMKPYVDSIKDLLKDAEELIDADEPINIYTFEEISDGIDAIENMDGYVPGTLSDLKDQLAELKSFSEFKLDIKDDSASELEDKLLVIQNTLEAAASNLVDEESYLGIAESAFVLRRQEALNKRLNAVRQGVKKDPILWANDAGLVNIELNLVEKLFQPLKNLEDKNQLTQSIEKRITQAEYISNHYGIPTAQIFTETEAASIADTLNSPDIAIETKGAILNAIGTSFGKYSRNVLRQVAENKTAAPYMHIAGMLANGADQSVVQQALVGMIKSQSERQPSDDAIEKMEKAEEIIGNLGIEPSTVNSIINIKQAANYIYLGAGHSTTQGFKIDAYEDALQKAAGKIGEGVNATGGIVEYNGRPTIIPNNILHDGGLKNIFDNLQTVDDLTKYAVEIDSDGKISKYYGNAIGQANLEPLNLEQIKNAQLITVGDGLYKLRNSEGQTVFTENGRPYVIDLKTLGPDAKAPDVIL